MYDEKRIIDKIRKLLALSASPNQAEAELAAQRAQELLAKYNLSMAEVKQKDSQVKEFIIQDGHRVKTWRRLLLYGICDAYFCQSLRTVGYNGYYQFIIVGKEHNALVAKEMFLYLESTIKRISREKCSKRMKINARENFRYGMAKSIVEKLQTRKQQSVDQENALILNLYANEKRDIDLFLNNQNLETSIIKQKLSNRQAYNKGFEEGKKVGIDDQIRTTQYKTIA